MTVKFIDGNYVELTGDEGDEKSGFVVLPPSKNNPFNVDYGKATSPIQAQPSVTPAAPVTTVVEERNLHAEQMAAYAPKPRE